jgi:hypothetical protein
MLLPVVDRANLRTRRTEVAILHLIATAHRRYDPDRRRFVKTSSPATLRTCMRSACKREKAGRL